MQAMLQEGEKWAHMVQDRDLRDAGIIASAPRIEHYEIAVYGSLTTWAKQLGLEQDLQALLGILEEEKRADKKLSTLAKRVVNPDAAAI
jgi:ferritin-like metal-binding protein YciE